MTYDIIYFLIYDYIGEECGNVAKSQDLTSNW